MARISVEVKRRSSYKNVEKQYRGELKRIVKLITNDVRNFALQNIAQGVKSGTLRPDGSRRSKAGEFPATDTGFLISNINGNIQLGGLSGIVESMADYSEALEFGTSKMGARPFLQPSLEQSRPKMKRLLGKIKVK